MTGLDRTENTYTVRSIFVDVNGDAMPVEELRCLRDAAQEIFVSGWLIDRKRILSARLPRHSHIADAFPDICG